MNAVATNGTRLAGPHALPVQAYATVAGVLVLLSFVAGGFGEAYVPRSSSPPLTPLPQWRTSSLLTSSSA